MVRYFLPLRGVHATFLGWLAVIVFHTRWFSALLGQLCAKPCAVCVNVNPSEAVLCADNETFIPDMLLAD